MDPSEAIKAFVTLLALVNPVGVAPIYLGLVGDRDHSERSAIARTAGIGVATIIAVSAVAGAAILSLFGIELASFRAAGGIILIGLGWNMLSGAPPTERGTPDEHEEDAAKPEIAIVPLAIPLLAGPGTIATTLVYASRAHGPLDYALLVGIGAAVGLITWGCLAAAEPLARRLGTSGVGIATKIFGLLLVAMGVEFVAKGFQVLWPGLLR
jgi:multiple antibiotic resistance protein